MTPTQARQLDDAEARTKWIVEFLRDGDLTRLIDERVEHKITKAFSTRGNVVRTNVRELAKLGASDALAANQ